MTTAPFLHCCGEKGVTIIAYWLRMVWCTWFYSIKTESFLRVLGLNYPHSSCIVRGGEGGKNDPMMIEDGLVCGLLD